MFFFIIKASSNIWFNSSSLQYIHLTHSLCTVGFYSFNTQENDFK